MIYIVKYLWYWKNMAGTGIGGTGFVQLSVFSKLVLIQYNVNQTPLYWGRGRRLKIGGCGKSNTDFLRHGRSDMAMTRSTCFIFF